MFRELIFEQFILEFLFLSGVCIIVGIWYWLTMKFIDKCRVVNK